MVAIHRYSWLPRASPSTAAEAVEAATEERKDRERAPVQVAAPDMAERRGPAV